HLMKHSCLRITYILCHAAVVLLLETEGRMGFTHPVTSGFAEFAFSAGHDLICRNPIPDLISLHVLSHFYHMSQEFMAGNKGRPHPGRILFISPEALRAVHALQISCTDAAGLCFDNNIVVSALRHREILHQPVLILTESNQGF